MNYLLRKKTIWLESKTSQGFTLLEVLVSLLILSIASMSVIGAMGSFTQVSNQSQIKTEAVQAVQQVMDSLRISDPGTMPTSGSDAPRQVSIGQRTYSVTVSYCSPNTYCTSNNVRYISANASWNNKVYYSVSTIYAQLR